jgi:hypothetical protein
MIYTAEKRLQVTQELSDRATGDGSAFLSAVGGRIMKLTTRL